MTTFNDTSLFMKYHGRPVCLQEFVHKILLKFKAEAMED